MCALSSACANSVVISKQQNLDSSSLNCQRNSASVPDGQKTDFEALQHTPRTFYWNCIFNGNMV